MVELEGLQKQKHGEFSVSADLRACRQEIHRRNTKCQPTGENTPTSLVIKECKVKWNKTSWKLTYGKIEVQKDGCTKIFIAILFVAVNN